MEETLLVPHDAVVVLNPLFATSAFVLGAVWGSFINVVIVRLPAGASLLRPPSHCVVCKTDIRWYDNVPIFSYLILRGRCRHCGTGFSPRYAVIELLAGVLALALYFRFGPSVSFLVYFAFALSLLAISFIDMVHWYIPDLISLPGMLFGLLASFAVPHNDWKSALLGMAVGGLGFLLLALLVRFIKKSEALGLGDVKLFAYVGAMLGISALPFIVFASALQGAIVGGAMIVLGRQPGPPPDDPDDWVPPPSAVPYGPFIALASLEYLFFGPELIDLYLSTLFGWVQAGGAG